MQFLLSIVFGANDEANVNISSLLNIVTVSMLACRH